MIGVSQAKHASSEAPTFADGPFSGTEPDADPEPPPPDELLPLPAPPDDAPPVRLQNHRTTGKRANKRASASAAAKLLRFFVAVVVAVRKKQTLELSESKLGTFKNACVSMNTSVYCLNHM